MRVKYDKWLVLEKEFSHSYRESFCQESKKVRKTGNESGQRTLPFFVVNWLVIILLHP